MNAMLQDYFRLMNMNGAGHVYRQALDSGLLDALANRPATAPSLAQILGLNEAAVALTLDCLATLGIVSTEGEQHALTELGGALIAGNYRHLGDPYWSHLGEFLKSGEPMAAMDDESQSERHYQTQAASLAWMLGPAAAHAAKLLDTGEPQRILDLGAGSAIWSVSLAALHPESQVTAVDWPAVLEIAAGTAQRAGVSDRIELLPGNYHEVELPDESFDLALVANVTHLESPEGNRDLFARARDALRPGGRIAVADILPGQAEGDLNRSLYALGLALRTRGGHVYAPDELRALLSESGFEEIGQHQLPVPPHAVGLMTARRV